MTGFTLADVLQLFQNYAYQPAIVYSLIVGLMLISSLGFPLPEEFTVLGAGFVGHAVLHPDPTDLPPFGANPVNVYMLAFVTFAAVLAGDFIIFSLGRFLSPRLRRYPRFLAFTEKESYLRVERWTLKYGYWTAGIFRFTPGLRFPGNLACGMLGVPVKKYLAVDAAAALVSIPTQILLISFYGDVILDNFKYLRWAAIVAVVCAAVYFLAKKFLFSPKSLSD